MVLFRLTNSASQSDCTGKIHSTFLKDPVVKSYYYELLREYNKLRKFKRKNFQDSILNQLQNKRPKNI